MYARTQRDETLRRHVFCENDVLARASDFICHLSLSIKDFNRTHRLVEEVSFDHVIARRLMSYWTVLESINEVGYELNQSGLEQNQLGMSVRSYEN